MSIKKTKRNGKNKQRKEKKINYVNQEVEKKEKEDERLGRELYVSQLRHRSMSHAANPFPRGQKSDLSS